MLLLDTITYVLHQAAPASTEANKGWNWPATASTGVALLALFVSLRTASRGKSLDIQTKRFERLGIQPVESSFTAIDLLFSEQGTAPASDARQTLTERIADVDIILSHIVRLYPAFKYEDIIEAGEEFKSLVFEGPAETLASFGSAYAIWKLAVLNGLYEALAQEVKEWGITRFLKNGWRRLRRAK